MLAHYLADQSEFCFVMQLIQCGKAEDDYSVKIGLLNGNESCI